MTLFGLDERQVRSLTAGVRASAQRGAGPEPGSEQEVRDQAAEVFARAAWSGIAEPGDAAAGLLVAGLGAEAALEAVLADRTAVPLVALLRAAGWNGTGHGGSDDNGLAELATALDSGLERWRPRLSSAEVIRSLEQARRVSARLLVPGDERWPAGINDLGAHAPIALWWRGVPPALHALSRSIALVGARAATGYGEHVAMEAAAGLVDRGLAIVSGAAYGIDGMVHRSALASSGITIAFLAGGVDRFYPSGHDALLNRIVHEGAVVSELPCGAAPTKWRFLQRNRLIAASSQATVVLEAGWRSGSLNTAGHAATLGRPLGAVPGPVTSPTSAGCHRLIREYDAVCVTTADQMLELMGESGSQPQLDLPGVDDVFGTARDAERTSDQVRVFDALSGRSARSVPDIARRSGLSMPAVLGALGLLNLDGSVRERETGWVRSS